MLRHAARDGRSAFGHVEARGFRRRVSRGRPAPPGVVTHVPQISRHGGRQKIRVERNDPGGTVEAIHGIPILAERRHRAGAFGMPPARLPLVPLRPRISHQKLLDLRRQRGRSYGSRQNPEPFTLLQVRYIARSRDRGEKVPPTVDVPVHQYGLGAIRIVQRQDAGLHENIRRAEARRMIRIPFDLGGTAQVTLDQQARGNARRGHRGRVEQGLAGNDLLGLPYVGNDGFPGLLGAGRSAGQRHGRAHQHQEPAARGRIVPVGSTVGKLLLDESLKLVCLGDLFQTSPVTRPAHPAQAPPEFVKVSVEMEFLAHSFTGGRSHSPSDSEFCIPPPAVSPVLPDRTEPGRRR